MEKCGRRAAVPSLSDIGDGSPFLERSRSGVISPWLAPDRGPGAGERRIRVDPVRGGGGWGLFGSRAGELAGADGGERPGRRAYRARPWQSPVPEVTIKGRSGARGNGAKRLNDASIRSQFAANFVKSWMKARWITPSAPSAPLFRLSGSSSEPR